MDSLTLSVITRAEDEDLRLSQSSSDFIDLRDNNCESNKTSVAIKQFNFFLKGYCDSKGHNNRKGFDPITKVEQLPYEGLALIHDDALDPTHHQKWWDDLIGNFFNYLAFDAHRCMKKEKGLISHETATGCASAVKECFHRRFRHKQLLVFRDPSW